MSKRVLSAEEAAAEYAPSLSAFYDWVKRGILPGPIEGTRSWFRDAIEERLREKCGLAVSSRGAGNGEDDELIERARKWRQKGKAA